MKTSYTYVPSTKAYENAQKISKPIVKCIKSKEVAEPESSSEESMPASPDSSLPSIKQFEDVSDIKYILAIS
jgi:hypothetical protein